MHRDYRITGQWRAQSDKVEPPAGFEGMQAALSFFGLY